MAEAGYLLDVNTLVALVLEGHRDHSAVTRWFAGIGGAEWGTCLPTEAAFLRVMTDPRAGGQTVEVSREALAIIGRHPGHRFWPIAETCNTLIAPFADRLFGHQHLTDAILLGVAVGGNGILVTMDPVIRLLAGPRFRQHVLVIEL